MPRDVDGRTCDCCSFVRDGHWDHDGRLHVGECERHYFCCYCIERGCDRGEPDPQNGCDRCFLEDDEDGWMAFHAEKAERRKR